jgi:Cytochrome P450
MALGLIIAAAAVLVVVFFLRRQVKLPAGTKLPPAPKGAIATTEHELPFVLTKTGKPLVGNLLDIPSQHSWLKFKEWGDQYGPIFRLNLAGQCHIVLSSEKVANDLLRERGNIYSGRPDLPAAARLLSANLRPVFLPHNGGRIVSIPP